VMPVGLVSIDISTNGVEFTQHKAKFQVFEAPEMLSLYPTFGPETGFTRVEIVGVQFPANAVVACQFGGLSYRVSADVVSSSTIVCESPAHAPGTFAVKLVVNGQHYVSNSELVFEYQPKIVLSVIIPNKGPYEGGSLVKVQGIGFFDKPTLLCKFGDAVCAAIYVDAFEVLCNAPPFHHNAIVSVEVSNNGIDFSGAEIDFQYLESAKVDSVHPRHGPADGGTRLEIIGVNFMESGDALCRFSGTTEEVGVQLEAPADVVSAQTLFCTTPDFGDLLPQILVVEISLNGIDFTDSQKTFRIDAPMALLEVKPSVVSELGGAQVSIVGENFIRTNDLSCRFGETLVAAVYITNNLITCITPASMPGLMLVTVTSNLVDFTKAAQYLEFKLAIAVASISPVIGPSLGGTVVHVQGYNFVDSSSLFCVFGSMKSRVAFVDDYHVTCVAPPQVPGSHSFGLSDTDNGMSYEMAATQGEEDGHYRYHEPLSVLSLAPSMGPIEGGTVVHISGSGFSQGDFGVWCKFESQSNYTLVAASYVSADEIECSAPSLFAVAGGQVGEVATAPDIISVSVSLNAVDFTAQKLQFSYYSSVAIFSVSPSLGPDSGGSIVSIFGTSFMASAALSCKFGEMEVVKANWITPSWIQCATPPLSGPDLERTPLDVSVSVSNNGIDFGEPFQQDFHYHRVVSVTDFHPKMGSVLGGTMVSVFGTNFEPSKFLSCRFGTAKVQARYVNDTAVLCLTSNVAGSLSVEHTTSISVSMNGEDFSEESSMQFQYIPAPSIYSIQPTIGPLQGGTPVRILGTNFRESKEDVVLCRFGDVEVVANFVSTRELLCFAPSLDDLSIDAHGSWTSVGVDVSMNGVDFTESDVSFYYKEMPSPYYLTPQSGNELGGTTIRIIGDKFTKTSSLACKFGDSTTTVAAKWVSEGLIECVAPSGQPGSVRISITTNGVDFTSFEMMYTYFSMANIVDIVPVSGPIGGGTPLNVSLSYLPENHSYGDFTCVFGKSVSVLAQISDAGDTITCVTPPQESPQSVELKVYFDGSVFTMNTNEEDADMFHYVLSAKVLSVHPNVGTIHGGLAISVLGSGFENRTSTSCRFGGHSDVTATFISSELLICHSPAMEGADDSLSSTFVSIEVSNNAEDFTHNNVKFAYQVPPRIFSFYPKSAGPSGSVYVTVHGDNFFDTPYSVCRFGGSITVVSKFISPSMIQCLSPSMIPGRYTVEVSNNNADFSENSDALFYVVDIPTVTTIAPESGPMSGGTIIKLSGTGMVQSDELACRFDGVLVPAYFLSGVEVACTTPPFSAQFADSNQTMHVSTVSVTVNREEFSEPSDFVFYPPAAVHTITPNYMPFGDVVEVTIAGSNFFQAELNGCRLGGFEQVEATVDVEAGTLQCHVTAPSTFAMADDSPSYLALEVSLNGFDFTRDDIKMWFYVAPVLESISPVLGKVEGGTEVTVYGVGFKDVPELKCRFGGKSEHAVKASWVSETHILCVSPAFDVPSSVSVALSMNGVHWTEDLMEFVYASSPLITAMIPQSSSTDGGGFAILSGPTFDAELSEYYCGFGDTQVLGKLLSLDALECPIPGVSQPGNVTISISNNGQDFVDTDFIFEYINPLKIVSLSPWRGTVAGGTQIEVSGTGFVEKAHPIRCRFGAVETPALVVVSSTRLTCVAPSSADQHPGKTFVQISNDSGETWSRKFVMYEYVPPLVITSAHPSFGTENGGTDVTVMGENFVNSEALFCQWGGLDGALSLSPAQVISSSLLTCPSPAHEPGFASMYVANANGGYTDGSSVEYEWVVEPTLTSFGPMEGAASGGTEVVIRGQGFLNISHLENSHYAYCHFGGKESQFPLEVVSDSEMRCVSPSFFRNDEVAITISFNGEDAVSTEEQGAGLFRFYGDQRVKSLTPKSGPSSGGTIVVIMGENFENMGTSFCQFGDSGASSVVFAKFVSPRELWCSTPVLEPGPARLKVSMDGVHFVESRFNFEAQEPVILSTVVPGAISEIGGDVLEISGDNFRNSPLLTCQFGADSELQVAATWVSSILIHCVAPMHRPASVLVTVSNNGVDFSSDSSLLLTYVRTFSVTDFLPILGPVTGQTVVTVLGTGFVSLEDLHCEIGGIIVPLEDVTDNQIVCTIPPAQRLRAGNVDFRVVAGGDSKGLLVDEEYVQYYYHEEVVVTEIEPSAGSSVGGTVVTVVADDVISDNLLHLQCHFWNDDEHFVVPAVRRHFESHAVSCLAPQVPLETFGSQNSMVFTVSLSANGIDKSRGAPQFTVYAPMTISSLHLASIPDMGMTDLFVTGSGFSHSCNLHCRFGSSNLEVEAHLVNATTIKCLAPPHSPGFVMVQVYNDGNADDVSSLFVEYQPPVYCSSSQVVERWKVVWKLGCWATTM